ncbi:hypothetical protein BKA61DRAFT_658428 [Leptodontidium sp. MPI-SDFR-AT-0119]|nr:hypothetical protein BKA61DRAFT_658428 [Leptodontidium sp. MPI-SDFR-AT-0119]
MSHHRYRESSAGDGYSRKRSRESTSLPQDEEMRDYNSASQNGFQTKKARPKPRPVDILYEIRCIQIGCQDKSFFQEKPFSGIDDSADLQDYLQTSVMDVFVDVTGTDITGKEGESRATFVPDPTLEPFILGRDFKIARSSTPGMYISSHHIQKMLRGLVKYYPHQTLTGQRVFVCHPYPVLHHYYDEMVQIMEDCKKKATDVGRRPFEQQSRRHLGAPKTIGTTTELEEESQDYETMAHDIGVLVKFLTLDHQKIVLPEMQRYALGVATFKMLWLLLKPGIDAYAKPKFGDTLAGYVISSVELGRGYHSESHPGMPCWAVKAWCLEYTGRHIFRKYHSFKIYDFKGEREITSLEVFPSSYQDNKDDKKLRKTLENRGERYFGIIRDTPAHPT